MSLTVRGLSCVYNEGLPSEIRALDGVSLSVEHGETVSVVGCTGSGKSTLAQHLNGLILPHDGAVTVDGVEISKDPSVLRTVRAAVGLVFQYPEQQIFAETLEEEIGFGPRNRGLAGDELHVRVAESMESIGLGTELLGRSPFALSGGQKRRAAIASVLASRPSYLVLDEPTAGLDADGERDLLSVFSSCAASGCGIVHITHDIGLALAISSRILVLDGGHAVSWGTPTETAEKLCSGEIKKLALPEVLKLSSTLRDEGKIKRLSWNWAELAEMIKEAF